VLLELKKVSVFYGKVKAVKEISLMVASGEFVAIIGANGAGKTSILNAISGLVVREGEICFKGERIGNLSAPEIAGRGVIQVPEGGKVFPILSVMDNLRMGAYLQRDERKFANTLERVFNLFPILKTRKNQRADSLSGGERQMLATGRALMADPKLLIMDEPTLGLSPLLCQELKKTLKEINRAGIPILLVEQNAHMGLDLSNRTYVFEKGEVVLEGNSLVLVSREEIRRAYLGA
jgi:branched-chain amino acid transport system ATP-binding protein